jgi:hypothetical protein
LKYHKILLILVKHFTHFLRGYFMKQVLHLLVLSFFIFSFLSCTKKDNTVLGPNEIGGDTNVDFVEPGDYFTPTFVMAGNPDLNKISNKVVVQSNKNGIVTLKGVFTFDNDWAKKMDTAFGFTGLSKDIKFAAIGVFLNRYGATLDTSDRNAMKVTLILKGKVTTEGVQEFMSSGGDESKPFTIVKYSANVGDKYQFTTKDGKSITREVTAKSTTDDFFWSGMLIKVLQVEEVQPADDPAIEKVIYYGNHKFGLVAVKVTLKNGKIISSSF